VTGYATNTETRRNLAALQNHGWRILLTPEHPRIPNGFRFAIDNGAWKSYQSQTSFDSDAFERLIERWGCAADWVVIPDIVAAGEKSLEFSVSWLPKLRHLRHLLLPIQDNMNAHDVGMILRQNVKVGLFLGGTTAYKLQSMYAWGMVAHSWNRYFHIGRVNTCRRIQLCAEAGADSIDGTSASMYSVTLPLLDSSIRQPSLLTPERLA
jgi:hypothetical protein